MAWSALNGVCPTAKDYSLELKKKKNKNSFKFQPSSGIENNLSISGSDRSQDAAPADRCVVWICVNKVVLETDGGGAELELQVGQLVSTKLKYSFFVGWECEREGVSQDYEIQNWEVFCNEWSGLIVLPACVWARVTKGKRLSGVEPVGYLKYLSATSRARAWGSLGETINEDRWGGLYWNS